MRVCHVITRLIIGGAQENTLATVQGLEKRHHVDVRLISGPTPPAGPEGSLVESIVGEWPRFRVLPCLIRPVHPWKDWMAFWGLVRLFRANRPHVVHTHSGKAGVLGRWAARWTGVPVIVHTIHGPSFGCFQGAMANAVFLAAERISGRFTTHFIGVANAMCQQYLRAGIGHPGDYSRIFSGFDLAPFTRARNSVELRRRWGIAPGDIVIGKVARLFQLKGHDALLGLAGPLVRQHPHLRFLLVGGGPCRERLERLVQERGLEQHVLFTGLVPPQEVPKLIGIMDILVHLSRREGLPRALPQAMAAGKPVIAFDADGAREVCRTGSTGMLVDPGDIGALAKALQELIAKPGLRRQYGKEGRRLAREAFSQEKMVDQIYRLYQRLLRDRGI